MSGTLWLVGTPIGNLGDVSDRAARTLEAVEVIACEDPRRTRKLLSHLGIPARRLVSFNEGNERRQVPFILDNLRAGRDVAVVSDAGMPGLSDPGYRLVVACVAEEIPVDVVPGPSAVVAALVVSGLPPARFAFEGFLPRKEGERRVRLASLADDPRTVVLFESPRRLRFLLADAQAALGDRRAAVVRELTKIHQEVLRGRLSELPARLPDEILGEIVVVIEGTPDRPQADLDTLGERVEALTAEGVPRKDAAARVAEEAGVSKRALYEASLRRR
jgi:16S rRNA (cytidine1402-2'-O)-methyltransferase